MTETVQAPYVVETAKELDDLPVDSIVVVKESEFKDHVGWQKTADVLNHKDDPEEKVAWASIFYANEHDSIDLLNMSYDNKALVVYVHPGK